MTSKILAKRENKKAKGINWQRIQPSEFGYQKEASQKLCFPHPPLLPPPVESIKPTSNEAEANQYQKESSNIMANELTGKNFLHDFATRRTVFTDLIADMQPTFINGRNQLMQTPLIIAVQHRWTATVETLLNFNPDLNCQDWNGDTALHHCIHQREKDFAHLLLTRGAATDIYNNQGKTCLHLAVESGNYILLRDILTTQSGTCIDTLDVVGDTPLMIAVKRRQHKIIQEILKYKPNTTYADDSGNTALHMATQTGDITLMRDIIEHSNINQTNQEG